MSSHWKELVLYIDGLFQRHNSQLLAADSLQLTGYVMFIYNDADLYNIIIYKLITVIPAH